MAWVKSILIVLFATAACFLLVKVLSYAPYYAIHYIASGMVFGLILLAIAAIVAGLVFFE